MAFEMTGIPALRQEPFLPASPSLAPQPAFKPVRPLDVSPTATKPKFKPPDWLRSIRQVMGEIAKEDEADVRSKADAPFRDTGPYRPPATTRAAKDPYEEFKRRGADPDAIIDQMREVYAEEIPDDLTSDEKGMLLMQLGFGVMAGGPGLVPALGQAGLGMLGSWQDLRREKLRAGEARKRGQLEILGRQADLAGRREERQEEQGFQRSESAADRQFRAGEGALDRSSLAARAAAGDAAAMERARFGADRAAEADAAQWRRQMAQDERERQYEAGKPQTDLAEINADVRAGRMTAEEGERAKAAALATTGRSAAPPADVVTAQTVATWRAQSEGRPATAQDFAAEYDRLRQAKNDPNARAQMILDQSKVIMDSMIGRIEPEEAYAEAVRQVDEAIAAADAAASAAPRAAPRDPNAPAEAGAPARPTTPEEYEDLPVGAIYIHPNDGQPHRKEAR